MAQPLIIDTDPGIDDAIAIMLAAASPVVDLRGIVAVSGNVGIDHTSQNAAALADLLALTIPVGRGASGPLIQSDADAVTAAHVHGENGLGGYQLPTSNRQLQPGVPLLAQLIEDSPNPPVVAAIGPLTNLALLIHRYPATAKKISRIVIMGGGTGDHLGNITPTAEFNIYSDPEAAAVVFGFGVSITMVGLHVTEKTTLHASHLPRLWESAGPVASLTRQFLGAYQDSPDGVGTAQHDSAALAAVIAPQLITSSSCHVAVETQGEFTRGMTVVDYAGSLGLSPNCEVVVAIDLAGFRNLIHERLTQLDHRLTAQARHNPDPPFLGESL